MTANTITLTRELAESRLAAWSPAHWECPCGTEPPKRPDAATPVVTIVSLREPACPFCGRKFKKEYRRPAVEESSR